MQRCCWCRVYVCVVEVFQQHCECEISLLHGDHSPSTIKSPDISLILHGTPTRVALPSSSIYTVFGKKVPSFLPLTPSVGPGPHPYSFIFPSSTLSFTFHFFPFLLYLFSYFSIPSLSTTIGSLHFQAGGHRRRLNLGLVCCVDFMLYVFFT